jgi:hypothetical protein
MFSIFLTFNDHTQAIVVGNAMCMFKEAYFLPILNRSFVGP